MVDLQRVTGFDWDAGNVRKSAEKHGVSKSEAEEVFANVPLLLADDPRHSNVEPRHHALGRSNAGHRLHITFTMRKRGELIRIISARPMNSKERSYYEKAP